MLFLLIFCKILDFRVSDRLILVLLEQKGIEILRYDPKTVTPGLFFNTIPAPREIGTVSHTTFDKNKFKHIQGIPGKFLSMSLDRTGNQLAVINKNKGFSRNFEISVFIKKLEPPSALLIMPLDNPEPEPKSYEKYYHSTFDVENFTENPFLFSIESKHHKDGFFLVCGESGLRGSYRLWRFSPATQGATEEPKFRVAKFNFDAEDEINSRYFELRLLKSQPGGFVDRKGRVIFPEID